MKGIKQTIKQKIYNSNYKMKKNILLESNPDYTDNTRYVFDEIIKRHINDKYKIIWFVKDKKQFRDINIKNVKFINRDKKIISKIIFKYYVFFSAYIIDCNNYIQKRNKNQFRIHLTHGMPLKIVREYTKTMGIVDIVVSTTDFFNKVLAEAFEIDEEKLVVTGYPRTDAFYTDAKVLSLEDSKMIIWMPTYRTNNNIENQEYKLQFKYGVPCIKSFEELQDINNLLKDNNIKLIIKLHPAEKDNEINKIKLSNIMIMKNELLEKGHHNIYELLNQSDGLITDYSSIYYDYMLKNKPIGMAISDIETYRKDHELVFEDFESNLPAEYINNIEDLKQFIRNVADGKDIKNKERNEKCKLYNKYSDGNSSKRVVDILETYMKENQKHNEK